MDDREHRHQGVEPQAWGEAKIAVELGAHRPGASGLRATTMIMWAMKPAGMK